MEYQEEIEKRLGGKLLLLIETGNWTAANLVVDIMNKWRGIGLNPKLQQRKSSEPPMILSKEFEQYGLNLAEQGLVAEFISDETATAGYGESFWRDLAPDSAVSKRTITRMIKDGIVEGQKVGDKTNDEWVVQSKPFAFYVLEERRKNLE